MKKHNVITAMVIGIIMAPAIVYGAAGVGPHNKSNMVDYAFIDFPDGSSTSTSNCSNCHYTDYVSRCETCHTNDTGGGYSDMSNWDNRHDYVTDSAPEVKTHHNLPCGDCHWAVTHASMASYYNNKLVSGTFNASSIVNTLLGTHTWNPDPTLWTDSNGDPGIGRMEEQWTSTITIPAGYTINHPDWTDPLKWMEKTGPERGLVLAIINSSGGFENENGTFEIISTTVNGDSSVTITFKGKLVLSSLYNVDQVTPDFGLYYHQMLKYAIGYCDDPNQPGLQIDTANPQICFQDMGGNPWTADFGYPYGSSNCPQDVECIHQDVFFAGPTDFAKTDGLGAGGIDSTPNGICQVCHLSTRYWNRNGSNTQHNSGIDCMDCHTHEKGFVPNCTLCHADIPTDMNGMIYSQYGTWGTTGDGYTFNLTGSRTPGAHGLHAEKSSTEGYGYNFSCNECHYKGMEEKICTCNTSIQIGFKSNGFDGEEPVLASTYDGQILNPPYVYEGTYGTTVTQGDSLVCSNVYCHSNGGFMATGKMNPNTTPPWDYDRATNGRLSCDTCHPFPVMTTGPEDPRTDTHGLHNSKGYSDCSLCHYETIQDTHLHSNRNYDVNFGPGATFQGRPSDPPQPLSFSYTFAIGGGTCSSNSCHSYWGFSATSKWGMNLDLKVIPHISGLPSQETDRVVTLNASNSACYKIVENSNPDLPDVIEELTCSYTWDYGGAGTIIGGNGLDIIIYQYDNPGEYSVSLTMTESTTNKTVTENINVSAQIVLPPPATANYVTSVNDKTVNLFATLPTSPEVVRVYVYWGDRTKTVYSDPANDIMSHTYAFAGDFDIRVQTIDSEWNTLNYTSSDDGDLTVIIP